jgi:hypothetical protein
LNCGFLGTRTETSFEVFSFWCTVMLLRDSKSSTVVWREWGGSGENCSLEEMLFSEEFS